MEWLAEQMISQILERSLMAKTEEEALYIFVTMIVERAKDIMPRLLQSQQRARIEGLLCQAVRGYLQEMMKAKRPNLFVEEKDIEIATGFYAYGVTGVLLEYVTKEHVNVEELTLQLKGILDNSMFKKGNEISE